MSKERDLLRRCVMWLAVASDSGIVSKDEVGIPTPNADACFSLEREITALLDSPTEADGETAQSWWKAASPYSTPESLRKALQYSKLDAVRLDDMERTKCYPFWNGSGWTYIVAAERSSKVERKGVGPTVRAAIDAAMSAQERK